MFFPTIGTGKAMVNRFLAVAIITAVASLAGLTIMQARTLAGDNPLSPATPAQGSAMTVDQIGDALNSYGKNTTTNNGQTDYSINVKRGKWNINIIISLSPNGSIIWMDNNLTSVPPMDKLDLKAVVNVLKKNAEIGPMFFAIVNGNLRLSYPLANANLNPAALRDRIDALVSTVIATESLWAGDALMGKSPPSDNQ